MCTHTAQPARPGALRLRPGRPRVTVSWALPAPCRSTRAAVSWMDLAVSQSARARPCALCRTRRASLPWAPCSSPLRAVSQAQRPYRGRVPRVPASCRGLASRPCHDTAACPAPLWSQYTKLYCNTVSPAASPLYVTIQLILSQCNLGSSPNQSLHQFFFFFRFSSLFFSYVLITKHTNNHNT